MYLYIKAHTSGCVIHVFLVSTVTHIFIEQITAICIPSIDGTTYMTSVLL